MAVSYSSLSVFLCFVCGPKAAARRGTSRSPSVFAGSGVPPTLLYDSSVSLGIVATLRVSPLPDEKMLPPIISEALGPLPTGRTNWSVIPVRGLGMALHPPSEVRMMILTGLRICTVTQTGRLMKRTLLTTLCVGRNMLPGDTDTSKTGLSVLCVRTGSAQRWH